MEETLKEFKEEVLHSEAVLILIVTITLYAERVHESKMTPPVFMTCMSQFGMWH